tara:strand:+ start:3283 stop:4899 length:1617 start_codon:yes stop_codon:yes gene_type:complete
MENGNEPAAFMVPINELNEWEKNPRVNDAAVDKVAASIRRFGFGAPIVARKEDSVIIAGHTRIKAARTIEGMTHVPVRYLDISIKEAEALALADNKLGEIAVWEDNMLAALLADLSEEEAVSLGFNEEELEDLLGDIDQLGKPVFEDDLDDLDRIPEDVKPRTNPGDVVDLGRHKLYCMDNIEVLRSMPDNSIDSIVTDPPYGIDFMNRTWDSSVPGNEWSEECLRVLKPGGHIISFAATRTFHRLVSNLENAGFEVRDTINWLYFSGFPKSLDLSKAIDKHFGVEPIGKIKPTLGFANNDQWNSLKNQLIMPPATTKEAKQAEGWGTALKPAFEPATLCRKPLSEKSVALNWLKWKTGGLNIDDCRFGYGDPCWVGPNDEVGPRSIGGYQDQYVGGKIKNPISTNDPGARWPANIYQCPKASRGEREEGCEDMQKTKAHEITKRKEGSKGALHARSGKTMTGDISNIHPTVKPIKLMRWLVRLVTPPGGTVLDTFLGSGTTMIAAEKEGIRCIGIEREPKYCDIIRARVESAIGDKP